MLARVPLRVRFLLTRRLHEPRGQHPHPHPENLVAGIHRLDADFGCTAFRAVGDLFLGARRVIHPALDAFAAEHVGESYVWDATGRINVLDRESATVLGRLRGNGLREVALGIESGSARILEAMDKRITPAMTLTVARRLLEKGIGVKGYFILGYPGETADGALSTLAHIRELWALSDRLPGTFRAAAFTFRPYPARPLRRPRSAGLGPRGRADLPGRRPHRTRRRRGHAKPRRVQLRHRPAVRPRPPDPALRLARRHLPWTAPPQRRRSLRWEDVDLVGGAASIRSPLQCTNSGGLAAKLTEKTAARNRGVPVVSAQGSLAAYLMYWLEAVAVHQLGETTHTRHTACVNQYLIPGLGKKKLAKLTAKDIRSWLNGLRTVCQCCARGIDACRKPAAPAGRQPRCCAIGKCCRTSRR